LSSIFSRLGIYHELQPLMQLGGATKTLNAIFPGQSVHVRVSDRGIEELLFDPDRATRLIVFRNGDGELDATLRKLPLETYEVRASGTIKHSLYIDGASAGLSDLLIMKLAELFGWDIDFALDIRKGDSFVVVYEEHYRDGEKLGDGIILAAEFTNNEQVFRVLRYTDSNGHTDYYSPDGRCIRRPFLRTPVEVARISSPFDLHRKHPILNTIRAHRGVDYAAPLGTPIKATGDGRVVERSTLGGYGLAVVLDHGSKYTTLYGHMSRFAHNIEVGKHVKQGQVIGYVGASGLATGPHLHYEFQINGMHHDPLTVSLPRAKPLAGQEMADYVRETQALHALLDLRVPGRVVMTMR
jgi:murein DD-endopeptidase MepM/ murein hydrolase activator NlpD